MKKYILILNLLLSLSVFAQVDSTKKSKDKPYRFSIGVTPQYIFMQGMRFEFGTRIKQSNSFLLLAPQLYTGMIKRRLSNDGVLGWGMETGIKTFFDRDDQTNFILILSGNYQNFNSTFQDYYWTEVNKDDLKYHERVLGDRNVSIQRLHGTSLIGISSKGYKIGYELCAGISYRKSWFSGNGVGMRDFNRNFVDYGSSGFVPVVRINLMFYI